jgi:beta-glucanase (GH16 family)
MLAFVLAAALAAGCVAANAAAVRPAVATSSFPWKPIFHDDFNGTKLTMPFYPYNDPRGQTPRTVQSVQVTNGMLELIGHYQSPYGWVGGGVGYAYTRTYGRWVVRFRADTGHGYDPVFLLWPAGTWPTDGEIDVAEVLGANRHGGWENLHIGPANRVMRHQIPSSVDFTKWHTMAVDWLPDHITMWLDGKALWTVKQSSGFVPTTPFRIALQMDEGCGGSCTGTTPTRQTIMYVDWVRIYAPA